MPRLARILTALAAVAFLSAFAFPLWVVRLQAPQYPEGIGMRIHIDDVRGIKPQDLDNINGLNHYIGMKRIEPDAIPELRLMPWLVVAIAATGVAVALRGRRRPLYGWAAVVATALFAGLADFWRWGYDYGHDLDPEAIIRIPGMAYQPPLIGSKHLLNFVAHSWPDVAGIIWLVAAGGITVAVWTTWRAGRGDVAISPVGGTGLAFLALAVAGAAGCARGPEPIRLGAEACAHCRMTVADARFAGQARTTTGRRYTFDSIDCLTRWRAAQPAGSVAATWVAAFDVPTRSLAAERAVYLRSDAIRPPMGPGLAAFSDSTAARAAQGALGGELLSWEAVLAGVRPTGATR